MATKQLIDVKTGKDYSALIPGADLSYEDKSAYSDFIVSEILMPRDLSEGMHVPSTSTHILGVVKQLKFAKARYQHEGGPWRNVEIEAGCFGLGAANNNAIDWHWLEGDVQGVISNVVLHFSPKSMEQVAMSVFDIEPLVIEMPHNMGSKDPLIAQLAVSLCEQSRENDKICQLYKQSVLQMLNIHLLSHYCTVERALPIVKGRLAPSMYCKIDEYICEYFNQAISVEEIASMANMSVYHFSRLFKETSGYSPRHYIILKRLNYSKRLLKTTNLTVEQIAGAVGYDNVCHFSRIFKKYEKCAPSHYRDVVAL